MRLWLSISKMLCAVLVPGNTDSHGGDEDVAGRNAGRGCAEGRNWQGLRL